ncbi:PAS and ANTAR domain-containing protein [Nocardia sp. XZ_19_385]|uniref:PAS and ANTAR domain-containing protein n=1 Tax=Nocardia sp. XZ_19_385 TaxID=2769488 RepID=UPI002815BB2C|nr:PAS and ANTAR domain-containing protein [Nocardia sp. XZ_19_385]
MAGTGDPDQNSDVQKGAEPHTVFGAGGPGFGTFRFWFDSQRWEWSPEVYAMHGYRPGEVEPTTELLLAHKHPEDRSQVAESIARSIREGQPFSSQHRFLDTAGDEHHVMIVSEGILDAAGTAIGTRGYYIDLNEALETAERATLDAVVPDVVEAHAVIEQAKGVLLLMYSITADQAFNVLSWRAQETNSELRDIAEALIAAVQANPPPPPSSVAAFDHLLLAIPRSAPTSDN